MALVEWWTQAWPAIHQWLTTGNAPGYLATVVAAFAATFAYRSSKASRRSADAASRQLARLQESDERERAEKRAEQARMVSIWYRRPENPNEYYEIWFNNASSLPVYKPVVTIQRRKPLGPIQSIALTHLSPKSTFTDGFVNRALSDVKYELPPNIGHGLQASTVLLTYDDVAGIRWKRNLDGRLARVRDISRDGELREVLLDPLTDQELPEDYYAVLEDSHEGSNHDPDLRASE